MTITKKQDGDTVIMAVEGRVDTTTSPELQKEILTAFQTAKNLTLDMEKLVYISSAGLRCLLIGQKTATSKGGKMELHNVGDLVMEILETVGFADILTIV